MSLEGLTLVNSRADGSQAKAHVMTAITIAPEQYFALGNTLPADVPPYLGYGYGADLGRPLRHRDRQAGAECGDDEIDSALYDGVKPGHSRELADSQPPDASFNDDAIHWCEETETEFDAGDYGTPGGENDCTPLVTGQCSDGGDDARDRAARHRATS